MATESSCFRSKSFAALLVILFVSNATADAADRPNRSTPSDVAAGRWMDALLDPSAQPAAPKRVKKSHPRRPASARRVSLSGKLVRNPDTAEGLPPFALVDRYGGVLRYVEPTKSVDLAKYLDKNVGVKHDTGDMLLATQLALPRISAREANAPTGLQLAQNLEPIPAGEPVPAGEVVGESTPIEGYTEEPIYIDGGYEDGLNFGGCPSCGDMTCGNQGGCGFGARGVMYFHGEYLLWRLKGMNTPPLVIQFNNIVGGVAQGPFTTLFGDSETLDDERHGGRFTFGVWLDDYGQWAIEGDYLALGELEENFIAGVRDGAAPPVGSFIGRPFFNSGVVGGNRGAAVEDVDTTALDGTVAVNINSEFQGAGLRLRHNLCCRPSCDTCCGDAVGCGAGVGCGGGCGAPVMTPIGPLNRLCTLLRKGTRHSDILYGVRWLSLDENLRVTEDLQDLVPPVSQIDVFDTFATENDFFGGEVGYETDWKYRRWSLNFLTKIAIGNVRQRVSINGQTFRNNAELNPPNNVGGLLAQRSVVNGVTIGNIGNYERDEFTMIPELGLTLGYNLTRRLKLTGGYTVLYWGNVVRPGDQIDIDVNANLIPRDGGPAAGTVVPGDHPRFAFRQTDLWAQGLNLGAEYTW